MGFFDILKKGMSKGSSINDKKCAYCEKESENALSISKKVGGEKMYFCSKECSRDYRKAQKKKGRKPPSSAGQRSPLPW